MVEAALASTNSRTTFAKPFTRAASISSGVPPNAARFSKCAAVA